MRFWLIPRQRRCPHEHLQSRLIDFGRSKMWWCDDCHVYWTTTGAWPWFWRESRLCQHPMEALDVEWGTREVWCLKCKTYLGHNERVPDWVNVRLLERHG